MTRKEVKGLGMPWEDVYGYAQAVKVDDLALPEQLIEIKFVAKLRS